MTVSICVALGGCLAGTLIVTTVEHNPTLLCVALDQSSLDA